MTKPDQTRTLELRLEDDEGARRVSLSSDVWHVIGSAVDAAARIADPTVSRRHASIRLDGMRICVRDEGSRNGTCVNGRPLRAGEETELADTQRLQVGECTIAWRVLDADETELGLSFDAADQEPERCPETPAATLAPIALDGFTRLALPALLRRIGEGCSRFELAGALAQAMLAHTPVQAIEVHDADADHTGVAACLFRSHPPPGDDADVQQMQGLVWRIERDARHAPAGTGAPWPLLEALLALARDAKPAAARSAGASEPVPASLEPVVQAIYRRARQVARSRISVLIRGESGTGKEVLARYLHECSAADRSFVAVNCAALPQDLLEAELFGVEKGVATGVDARAGLFERADGGTLFLDEIGDMELATQARILRVLQEGEVVRVGGRQPRAARVRVVAATHQPLEAMVADGRFRLDLLHRISDWEVTLPSLRERPRDIGPLALHFLGSRAAERPIRLRGISRRALDCLESWEWPGNIRELEREMARIAVFLDDGATVTAEDLRADIRGAIAQERTLEARLAAQERRWIEQALAQAGGKVDVAARQLGISRSTLYRKLGRGDTGGCTDGAT